MGEIELKVVGGIVPFIGRIGKGYSDRGIMYLKGNNARRQQVSLFKIHGE